MFQRVCLRLTNAEGYIKPNQITIIRTIRPEVFYIKRCSKKFRKIHRKTPVPDSLF